MNDGTVLLSSNEILQLAPVEYVIAPIPPIPVEVKEPSPVLTESLLTKTLHFLCRVAAQDPRFRSEGTELVKEYEIVMEAHGIHFCGCSCGCNGLTDSPHP